MDIRSALTVTRYLVEFREIEVSMLQALDLLPSDCGSPAKIWLTAEQISGWAHVVGAREDVPAQLADARQRSDVQLIRTVHVVIAGRPLCDFSQCVPGYWDPAEHVWIRMTEFDGGQIAGVLLADKMCVACCVAAINNRLGI